MLEELIIQFSYVAIFIFLYINGIIGFPSSQLIYIIGGWFAFKGDLSFISVVIIGAIAHYLGNVTLYELSRKNGVSYANRLNKFFSKGLGKEIFSSKDIKKVQLVIKKKGLWFLFLGKLVNPIKIILNIPAGIAMINRITFNLILISTSTLWAIAFTYLGYAFGKDFQVAIFYSLGMLIMAVLLIISFNKTMHSEEILKQVEE